MKLVTILSVIFIIAIQAVSPLYNDIANTQHKEEMPNDGNSENEVKDLEELEEQEIVSDKLIESSLDRSNKESLIDAYYLIQQFHIVLPVPPPEQK